MQYPWKKLCKIDRGQNFHGLKFVMTDILNLMNKQRSNIKKFNIAQITQARKA